jgi:hypothetical protein
LQKNDNFVTKNRKILDLINRKKRTIGISMLIVSLLIGVVSAYLYETANQTVTQTIQNIATVTLKNSALGTIEEGQTKTVTKTDVANLGAAISLTTTKAGVYMHLTSSDLAGLSTYYSAYSIAVKVITKPTGGVHTVGETVATLTLASPTSGAINLDVIGSWAFDFEVTMTAKSVSSDQATTVTIVATAEST